MSVSSPHHIPVVLCLQAAMGSTHGFQQSDNPKGLRSDPGNISLNSFALCGNVFSHYWLFR
jgi:hypothetical protein